MGRAAPPRPAAGRGAWPDGRTPSLLVQLRRIEREGGDGVLRFPGGRSLLVSSLDRVVFPGDAAHAAITKGALLRYYVRVERAVVPAIAGRALVLTRHPAGVGGPAFHQHDPGDDPPDAVDVALLPTSGGEPARRLVGSLGSLLHAVQLGAVGVDAWHARAERPDHPDYVVLDLDPPADAGIDVLVRLAHATREELSRRGHDAVVKTSGSRGLHLLAPLGARATFEEAAALAEEVAAAVVRRHPEEATVERAIHDRPTGAVYVDHLQNARGKTLAAAFCARARPHAPISTPLTWAQVRPSLDLHRVTVATAPRQIAVLHRRWRENWDAVAPKGAWRPS